MVNPLQGEKEPSLLFEFFLTMGYNRRDKEIIVLEVKRGLLA